MFIKYAAILSCLRFLIASLIPFTALIKFVSLSDCVMLTCPIHGRNLCNSRIKESVDRSPENTI